MFTTYQDVIDMMSHTLPSSLNQCVVVGSALEQFGGNGEVVEAADIHILLTVAVGVFKVVFPLHMSDQKR